MLLVALPSICTASAVPSWLTWRIFPLVEPTPWRCFCESRNAGFEGCNGGDVIDRDTGAGLKTMIIMMAVEFAGVDKA